MERMITMREVIKSEDKLKMPKRRRRGMRRRRRCGVAGVAVAADAGSEISNAPKTGRDYSAEEGRGGGWFTDFHGRQGGSWQWHGLGIKPTALLLVRPKLSLLVGPVTSLLGDGSLSIL